MKEQKVLLDVDLNGIIDLIPANAIIKLRQTLGRERMSSYLHEPGTIRKLSDGTFVDDKGKPYSKPRIYTDVSNKRILLSDLIMQAETRIDDLGIDRETGRVHVYNTTLENMENEPHLKSDALILFAVNLTAEEVKNQNILLEDKPIKLSQYVYDKITAKVATSNHNAHHFCQSDLSEIKRRLLEDRSLAVVRTKTKDGGAAFAVLTGAKDYKGDLIMVVIAPDLARDDNYISSIYGKEHVPSYLLHQREAGNLAYINPDIVDAIGDKLTDRDRENLATILDAVKREKMQAKTSMTSIMSIVKDKRAKKGGNSL